MYCIFCFWTIHFSASGKANGNAWLGEQNKRRLWGVKKARERKQRIVRKERIMSGFFYYEQEMGSNTHAVEKLHTFKCNFIRLSTKRLRKVKHSVMKCMPFISFASCWEKAKNKQNPHLQRYKYYKMPYGDGSCEHSMLNLSEKPGLESNPRFRSHPACHNQEDHSGDASAGGWWQMLCSASLTHSPWGMNTETLALSLTLSLQYGDSLWEVMEVRLEREKTRPLTTRREVEGSDFWKEWGKLTGSISGLKSPKVPPFLGSNGIGLNHTWKFPCRNAPASSG